MKKWNSPKIKELNIEETNCRGSWDVEQTSGSTNKVPNTPKPSAPGVFPNWSGFSGFSGFSGSSGR